MQGGRVFAGVCGGFVNGFGCASRQHGLSLEIRFGDGFNKAADLVKFTGAIACIEIVVA